MKALRNDKPLARAVLLASLVGLAPWAPAAAVPLAFDTNRVNQLSVTPEPDQVAAFRTTGGDPFILLQPFDPPTVSTNEHVLAFEYFCPDGLDDLEVFFGPPIVAGSSLNAGELKRAESWQPFAVNLREASGGRWSAKFNLLRLDFGRRAGVELRVRHLHLRPPNEAEQQSAAVREAIRRRKAAAAALVMDYLEADLPAQITSIRVTHDEIQLTGNAPGRTGAVQLFECPPWRELWDFGVSVDGNVHLQTGDAWSPSVTIELSAEGSFSVSVPRFENQRDRLTSRWALAVQTGGGTARLVSHFTHPTDLTEACEHPQLDRKAATGIKGMGGVWANDILNELVELGVRHITANLAIDALLSPSARPGWPEHRHGGRTWWVNAGLVESWDRLHRFATEHGMIVSAIILIRFADNDFARLLVHPGAERSGQYAMPNLTTREGVEAYEAAVSYLAERYAQPGDPHGRISNWILHNEVDYGWEWTNMGAQPLAVYLDTYVRSMRLVHTLARRFNPHARVFISLTHNWNVPDDPAWKTYGPRRLLELLARFSRVEGEFEWGVAYHPYPQSLFKADAWNDTLPTDSFDTPLITPKNLAVLDRWMHRPEMRFNGRVRGVLLSEQGFHTPDDSAASERLQAAAFVYTWKQMRGLASIEAFHNHRWVDHPAEGGLKLGLRTLPTADKPYGDRKFAWQIYQALDTPREAATTRFADEIIDRDE